MKAIETRIIPCTNTKPTRIVATAEGGNRLTLSWSEADSDGRAHESLTTENARLREALQNALNVLAGLAIGDLKTINRDSPAIAQARAALKGTK